MKLIFSNYKVGMYLFDNGYYATVTRDDNTGLNILSYSISKTKLGMLCTVTTTFVNITQDKCNEIILHVAELDGE